MNDSMNSLFVGRLVRLRAIEPDDAETIFRHRQDDEISRMDARIQWPQSLADVRHGLEARAKKKPTDDEDLMIETLDGHLVGDVNVQTTDSRSGTFSIGIGLKERSAWGKGYAREAMLLMLRYMYHERRYQKCNLGVYADNKRAIAFYRHLGFIDEGRLRRNHFTDGEYHDEILLGMTREEFDQRYPQWRVLLQKDGGQENVPPD
jgi:RimJ/RimL family protein N-acetyltransferase